MGLRLSWEAANYAASKKFPNILWNPNVHYRVHKSSQWSLSWARSIPSTPPHPISLRAILTLPTHLRHDLPNGLFPSGFPTNILYAIFSPFVLHSLPISSSLTQSFGKDYKLQSSSLCSFLQPPFTLSLFGPNILLRTLFSNTLSLCFSPNVRDQVSHPHRTTG
jgi:hypothetical protein